MRIEQKVPRERAAENEPQPRKRRALVPDRKKMSAASAAKYQKLTEAASPSSPSVRLTQFVAATNTNAASGIIHAPMSTEMRVNGMFSTVSPSCQQ